MDFSRALDVLVVCVPIFAMIGLGKLLERRGILNADHRQFANNLIYYLSLPALIFAEVSRQRFFALLNAPLVLGPVCAIAVVMALFVLLARVMRIKGALAAAFVFGTFWANVTYMGFPLCQNAFGQEGLALAAVYNAFVMPLFIILGFSLIGIYGSSIEGGFGGGVWRRIIGNPVVLAALLGMAVSMLGEIWRTGQGGLALPGVVLGGLRMIDSLLRLIGAMGLPLALLAIGGSMHLSEVRRRKGALALVLAGKLVLLPLAALVSIKLFFPQAEHRAYAVAVMLCATPNAVASYVVSRQIGVEEGFVSAMLVFSTALSVITLPVWLYIVLIP